MGGIIAVVVGVFVALIVWAVVHDADIYARKGQMERTITRLCDAHGGAVFFDVEGENKMVYACNDNHVLRVRAY